MTAARRQGTSTVQLAVSTVGAVTLGVPMEAVLQALPLAGALHPLPRRQGALCGVVEHAGALVPVVDLARWVDVGVDVNARSSSGTRSGHDNVARILMLGEGRRTIGLRVDAVVGLFDVPALTQVLHDQDPEEVFDTVVKSAELDRVISVLNVGRLIALTEAWHGSDDKDGYDSGDRNVSGADAASRAAANAVRAGASSDRAQVGTTAGETASTLYALLTAGDTRIALPAATLTQVKRMPPLQPLGAAGGNSYCTWRNRKLAVIDTIRLLKVTAAFPLPLLAIVEHGDLALGLMVHEVLQLRMLATPSRLPGSIVATVIDEDGGAIEVIDVAALLACLPEASISRVTAEASGLSAATAKAAAQRLNNNAYIVFQTDQKYATAIDPIEEILALTPVHVGALEQLLPTIAWRGQPLPTVDLRPPGTPTPLGCGARIIVARSGSSCTGFVVEKVELLIPPNTGKLFRMALAGMGLVEFITTGAVHEQVTYRTMELVHPNSSAASP